jgi:hypothetical protein
MEAQVGSNGPGVMGKSSFSSGNELESPNGTLSSARGGGTSGSGAGPDRVAQPAIMASNAMTALSDDACVFFMLGHLAWRCPTQIEQLGGRFISSATF